MPDEKAERTTVTLPRSLARRLRAYARAHDASTSGVVRDAVERYLADAETPPRLPFIGIGASGRPSIAERFDEEYAKAMEERFRRKMGR